MKIRFRFRINHIVVLLLLLFISACSTTKLSVDSTDESLTSLLRDDLVLGTKAVNLNTPNEDILTLDEAIKHFLNENIRPIENDHKRINALNDYLLKTVSTGESFQELRTKTAVQTFYSRKANCLSYANLFIAAARYVDLEVDYHLVFVPPNWSNEGNTWILNHHINILSNLSKPHKSHVSYYSFPGDKYLETHEYERKKYLFDLNRVSDTEIYRGIRISDNTAHAYFYSNIAAEALVEGNIESAYLNTRQAILTSPSTSTPWNNLGIIYNRLGHSSLAEKAFMRAHTLNDDDFTALSNLARLYIKKGDHRRAAFVSNSLRKHKLRNPYYHFSLASDLQKEGKYDLAISHLDKAIKLKEDDPRFYYTKSRIFIDLKQFEQAQDALEKAYFYALPENRKHYYAKFEYIKSLQR